MPQEGTKSTKGIWLNTRILLLLLCLLCMFVAASYSSLCPLWLIPQLLPYTRFTLIANHLCHGDISLSVEAAHFSLGARMLHPLF